MLNPRGHLRGVTLDEEWPSVRASSGDRMKHSNHCRHLIGSCPFAAALMHRQRHTQATSRKPAVYYARSRVSQIRLARCEGQLSTSRPLPSARTANSPEKTHRVRLGAFIFRPGRKVLGSIHFARTLRTPLSAGLQYLKRWDSVARNRAADSLLA